MGFEAAANAEREAKNRLRDAITASGVSCSTAVGLFSLANQLAQAHAAKLMAERDEAPEASS